MCGVQPAQSHSRHTRLSMLVLRDVGGHFNVFSKPRDSHFDHVGFLMLTGSWKAVIVYREEQWGIQARNGAHLD